MNTYETTKQKKQINRGVYGLLGLLVIVFGLILFVLQFHDNESDRRHDIANNYHLAISEKGLALLGAIDNTKLWFLDRDINNQDRLVINNKAASPSPLHMGFSRRDEINLLKYYVEKIAVEISTIQKQYPDPEFKVVSEIFEEKRIKTQAALKILKPTNLNIYKVIDDVVTPLRSVTHQLQLLHRNAYREIQLSKEAYDRERGVQLIGLICVLVVIGLLSVLWLLRYFNNALKDLTNVKIKSQSQARIIDQIHDAVISTNLEGFVTGWNKGSEKLFGYLAEEIIGRHISIVYPEESHDFLQMELIPELKAKGDQEVEIRLLCKSGESFFAHLSLSMIYDQDGNAEGMIGYTIDITDRKQAEESLKESEALLEKAQKLANVGHWKLIPETGEVTGSDELFNIFGFPLDEATLDAFIEVVHPDDREMDTAAIQRGVKYGESWDIEHRLICRDGTEKWVRAIGEALTSTEGRVVELLGTVQDITVLKKTELALVESELWMTSIYNSLDEAVLVVSADRKIVNINEAALSIFGYSDKEIYSASTELFHVDHQHYVEFGERINQAFSKNQTANFEFEAKRKNGHIFPTEHTVSLLKNPGGETKGIVSVIRDITERNLAEHELRHFRGTLDKVLDCVFMFDEDLCFFYVNDGALQHVGYTREELLSMHPFEIKPEFSEAQFRELIAPLLNREEASLNFETIHEHKNGDLIPVEIFLQYILSEDESARYVAIVRDISERKKTEAELARVQDMLEQANKVSKMGAWDFDLTSNELVWSDITKEIHEVEEDFKPDVDTAINFYKKGIHRDTIKDIVNEAVKNGGSWDEELIIISAKGNERWVRAMGQPEYKDGACVRLYGSFQDITNRKIIELELDKHRHKLEDLVEERTVELREMQDELVRKERLATLGQLTATVSHELRNPLGAMRPSLYVIDKISDKNDEKIQRAIGRIDRSIDRCDHIIDELLDFTRITELKLQETRADEWLESIINEQNIPEGIRVEKEFSLKNLKIRIDQDRLRRAVINVIENACHAMLDDKHQVMDRESACLNIKTMVNDQRIIITIADTGTGIQEHVLTKIFEPLFSTKGFGVGLGMPIVRQIIEQHGGGIEIDTEEDIGTKVSLWLPLNENREAVA